MLVVPLADADVNVPGVMATLVAPVAAQLSVLLAPEFMLVGFAEKELIVGAEPFPEDELVPQPTSPTQTARMRSTAERCSLEESFSHPEICVFPQLPFGAEVRSLDRIQLFGCIPGSLLPQAVVAVALSGRSPLDRLRQLINRVIRVIRHSTAELAASANAVVGKFRSAASEASFVDSPMPRR